MIEMTAGEILKFAIKIFTLYQNNQSVWIGENQTIYKAESNSSESGPFLYFQSGGTSGSKKWVQHHSYFNAICSRWVNGYLG